jgi:hypothetical protein
VDRKQKRGCLWIALGVGVVVVMVGAALVGGLAWVAYQNFSLNTEQIAHEDAAGEFERLRARFAGQQPLITLPEGGEPTVVRRTAKGSPALEWLHVVSYDPADRRMARLRIPFWLLRLSPGGSQVTISGDAVPELQRAKITFDDIEAAGPGLVLDHAETDGRRVLVWAE